jgi:hypothetical protein
MLRVANSEFVTTSKGEANVTIKDSIFQRLSPIRHVVELLAINKRLKRKSEAFTLAFMDGELDHNISFLNVMASWLAYFILACYDSLVVGRTVMSVLNLALSNCALAR